MGTNIDYSEYLDLNEIPEIESTEEIDNMYYDEYPEFAKSIASNPGIFLESKEEFVRRFLRNYLLSEQLRERTRDYVFLIAEGRYIGIYPSDQYAMDAAAELGYKGYEIYLIPVEHHKIYYEMKEVVLSSLVTTQHTVGNDDKTCRSVVPEYFKVNCGIISNEIEDKLINEIIVEDEYLVDSGCTISHLGNTEYINYNIIPNRYNNYPYDSNGIEIKNEKLRRDQLLTIKDFIVKEKEIITGNAHGGIMKKTELLFSRGISFVIDKIQKIPLYNGSIPVCEILEKTRRKGLISHEKYQTILWPRKTQNLLGLNSILEVGGTFLKPVLGLARFVFTRNKKLEEGKDYYKVFQVKPGFGIYSAKKNLSFIGGEFLDERFTNNKLNLFGLSREYLFAEEYDNYIGEKYINLRSINLLILENYNELLKLQEKVENNNMIDGIITKSFEPPYYNQLWLKDFSILYKIEEFIIDRISFFKNHLKYEIDELMKFVMSEWNISKNLMEIIRL